MALFGPSCEGVGVCVCVYTCLCMYIDPCEQVIYVLVLIRRYKMLLESLLAHPPANELVPAASWESSM